MPIDRALLAAACPWIPTGPVLDLGAGHGQISALLQAYGFAVSAVDADTRPLAAVQAAQPELQVIESDLRQFDIAPGHWAAIVCLNVTPFLPQADVEALLRRLAAGLKPGGVLIFSGFHAEDPAGAYLMAEALDGQPAPTGQVSLAMLPRFFTDWPVWFAFEGPVEDDHPPQGPHRHVLSQWIIQKPEVPLEKINWPALPRLGTGMGWRAALHEEILASEAVDFLEIMTDDHHSPELDQRLLALRQRYTLIPHGVELSPGTPGGATEAYLKDVARIVARCDSPWWSDHLCYTHSPRYRIHSLNPLPPGEESLTTVLANLKRARQHIPRPLLLENPAYYASVSPDPLQEAAFFKAIVESADCGILLDVANLMGNAYNLGLDPYAYFDALPAERIVQLHLAGGRLLEEVLFDTHDRPIWQETWELLRYVLQHSDVRAVSLEWDDNYELPARILEEVQALRRVQRQFGLRL